MKILKKYSQYIKASLTEQELDSFTKEIVKDYFEKETLQDKWGEILHNEHDTTKSIVQAKAPSLLNHSKRYRIMRALLYAAASIVILMISWFTYESLTTVPTYNHLVSEELNNPYIEDISRKGTLEALKLTAVEAYNDRAYGEAVELFEQLREKEAKADWNFYIGLCRLYLKEVDSAIDIFTVILDQPNRKYEIETHWYLGLAYTMKEDFVSARTHMEFLLEHSESDKGWKVKEAKAFLKAFRE